MAGSRAVDGAALLTQRSETVWVVCPGSGVLVASEQFGRAMLHPEMQFSEGGSTCVPLVALGAGCQLVRLGIQSFFLPGSE